MYHMSAQGVDERMINVHYYYYRPDLKELAVPVQYFSNRETFFLQGVYGIKTKFE